MFVELHIIQNFAPSNLNRDDTGSPKDCEFGGYRRACISSQCLKRALRDVFKRENLLNKSHLAARTKRLVEAIANRIHQKDETKAGEDAKRAVEMLLSGIKLSVKDDGKTEYLLFLGSSEIAGIAKLCLAHWDDLMAAISSATSADAGAKKVKSKEAKKASQDAVPDEIRKATLALLNGGKAADLALFGRMLADLPDKNIDAASQVAHALSTNKVGIEFDFYTAVDDLRPSDTQGSDMLGTVEFNSACFYRYSNVDLSQLKKNLDGDEELTHKTLEAFIRASVAAIPSGKQNSMAAQNPPSFVMIVARKSGLWSLANAFVKPVRPDSNSDLITESIKALDQYWGQLTKMYGDAQIADKWYITLDGHNLEHLNGAKASNLDETVLKVLEAVKGA